MQLSALATQDFPLVSDLLANNNFNTSVPQQVYGEIFEKAGLGFNVSFADIFGLNQGYNLYMSLGNSSIDPLSWTWSGIQAKPKFQSGNTPMAILMGNEVIPQGLSGSNSYTGPNGTILVPAPG